MKKVLSPNPESSFSIILVRIMILAVTLSFCLFAYAFIFGNGLKLEDNVSLFLFVVVLHSFLIAKLATLNIVYLDGKNIILKNFYREIVYSNDSFSKIYCFIPYVRILMIQFSDGKSYHFDYQILGKETPIMLNSSELLNDLTTQILSE
jgi:hypothetical protein